MVFICEKCGLYTKYLKQHRINCDRFLKAETDDDPDSKMGFSPKSPPTKRIKLDATNEAVIDFELQSSPVPSSSNNSIKLKVSNEVGGMRYCDVCAENVPLRSFIGHLRSNRHTTRTTCTPVATGVVPLQSAFKSRIVTYRVSSEDYYVNVFEYMNEIKSKILPLIQTQIEKFKCVKCNFELFGLFILEKKNSEQVKSFNSANQIATVATHLEEYYTNFVGILDQKVSEFCINESGWALKQLLYVDININRFCPLRGSSFLELPKQIEYKKAVVNVQNDDELCFGWSIMAAICEPVGKPYRTSSYINCTTYLNFRDIEFPVRLCDVSKFENYNPQLSVNVYGLEKFFKNNVTTYEIVGPLYFSPHKNRIHINLLLLTDEHGNSHYTYIRNLSRLVSKQLSKHKGMKHICNGCLHYFETLQQLTLHEEHDCNHVYTKLPTTDLIMDRMGNCRPENILQFTNYQKKLKVPFTIYADFETILKPILGVGGEPNLEKPFVISTCEHIPYSFAYFIKCSFDDRFSKFEIYCGEDAVKVFMERLEQDVRHIYFTHLKHIVPMKTLTAGEMQNFEDSVSCHICDLAFGGDCVRVRDHDHQTGAYRGAAHSTCNLNYKIPNFVPVFFHNLNYDSHLFIKQMALKNEDIQVIPQNKEKYISFGKSLLVDAITGVDGKTKQIYMQIRFLDSFRFMNLSLATLAENLSLDQCVELQKKFGCGKKFNLMRQKGVFPYSYMDSFSKLNESSLPSIEQFHDTLNDEPISQADYQRALDVWETFDCKTLADYSAAYLSSDIFMLADVFENFRALCLQHYQLDPTHYYTAPGLCWDAMLKYSGVQLELLTDMDMYHFFKNGVRGGVSTCVARKAVANNMYVGNFDSSKPTSFIMYLDATNLYGYAMRQYLPEKDFQWLSVQEVENFNVFDVLDDSNIGYVLEVDLQYPSELHDDHNDFPFCPELIVPPNGKFKFKKLIPNLFNKNKYIIHYRNLQQCLDAGLFLTKIHRIVKFKQSPWLMSYIDLNTKLRNQSNNAFEKMFFKLSNNSVFGKTLENVDKRVNVKLLSHWEKIGKKWGVENYIAKPNYKNLAIFCENLVAIEMNRTSVFYNKPCYVGFSVLDISKTVMYDFYYNFLKTIYGHNVSLLYTDTDSLILEIFTDNFYSDMKKHIKHFDTANYKNNLYGIPQTESVVGKMKDEYAGTPIESFYGVAAKTYCVNVADKIDKKAKGVKKSSVKKYLTSEMYQEVAENALGSVYCKMYVFRSRLHTMYTDLLNKVALAAGDDKRFAISGSTKTLAWGHTDIHNDKLDELLRFFNTRDQHV